MPQQQRLKWTQLRVGTMVIIGLAIFALGIFFISGQEGFFRRRYKLKAYVTEAAGLRQGAQVSLAGVAVGSVERIEISPYPERARAVEIVMRVARAYQHEIRADSRASIETVGLLGDSYVNITRGSPGQEVIADGGVLITSEEADVKRVVQNANDVFINLRVLSAKLNDISGQIQSGKGSAGKLIYDQTLYNRLNKTADTVDRMVTRVDQGQGTLGKLMADETLYNNTVATIDRLNKAIDDMQHGPGSLAKFISDPSVYNNLDHLVTQANSLVDNISQGQGTLGKLAKDPQLYNRLNETFDHLNAVSTRMDQGQGTLGKLSTDTTLYNNLSQSSESLRDFLTEFKKNPKKYLTVRVHIF
ncbi:MAG: MlaD family protein [Terriglobia bacterium]|jgi:phospholipid/cholesterol/gamma-HCH transport system substrate-binding protein